MPIELGKHEDGYKVRISDSGGLERKLDGVWETCTAATLCDGVFGKKNGLNGECILTYRMLMEGNRTLIIRNIDDSYFDVDRLQTRLERDLDKNRHCIR